MVLLRRGEGLLSLRERVPERLAESVAAAPSAAMMLIGKQGNEDF